MWVAKGKYTGKIYSKRFENIEECQKYIDKNLENEMKEERILCYNVKQKRFCDSFDF